MGNIGPGELLILAVIGLVVVGVPVGVVIAVVLANKTKPPPS
jgi:hypothetical protein